MPGSGEGLDGEAIVPHNSIANDSNREKTSTN